MKYTTVNGDEIQVGSVCITRNFQYVKVTHVGLGLTYPVRGDDGALRSEDGFWLHSGEDHRDLMYVVATKTSCKSSDTGPDPLRMELAKAAMQGLLAGGYFEYSKEGPIMGVGRKAFEIADQMIEEMGR